MSNVVRLFSHEQIEKSADPTSVTIAVADFLGVFAELARAMKLFSKNLDSIEHVIDLIGDSEARKRQDQLREESTMAVLELSQVIRMLPILQISADLGIGASEVRGP
jgi:hypothetical protein